MNNILNINFWASSRNIVYSMNSRILQCNQRYSSFQFLVWWQLTFNLRVLKFVMSLLAPIDLRNKEWRHKFKHARFKRQSSSGAKLERYMRSVSSEPCARPRARAASKVTSCSTSFIVENANTIKPHVRMYVKQRHLKQQWVTAELYHCENIKQDFGTHLHSHSLRDKSWSC